MTYLDEEQKDIVRSPESTIHNNYEYINLISSAESKS